MAAIPTSAIEDAPWPDRRLAWLALALLMGAMIASQLDRMLINLVVGPVKQEFGLTDTQFAMLQGIAFGIFYAVMPIPLGMLADRFQRRLVIGFGIGLFSLFSVATGFTRNYMQLFLARMGVGVGEASVAPAGFSIIADYFPPHRLGRAISLFTMGSTLGTAGAYIGGGAAIGWLTSLASPDTGLILGAKPWQLAFLVVSVPGLLLAPCFFLMREPQRRGLLGRGRPASLRELWPVFRRCGSFLSLFLVGMSMVTTVSYAVTVWTPAVFMRVYGWTAPQIGLWFGLLVLLCGAPGSYVGGWLVDRLRARGVIDGPLKVSAIAFAGCGICGTLAPLMPSAPLALLMLAPTMFLKFIPFACAPTALQLIVPNELRSQVSALYLSLISLVGITVGPIVVGLLTDYVFRVPAQARYSLAIVVGCASPIMVVLVLASCRAYRRLAAAAPAGPGIMLAEPGLARD
jgi:MFS family permease